jgi:hypothetical protein
MIRVSHSTSCLRGLKMARDFRFRVGRPGLSAEVFCGVIARAHVSGNRASSTRVPGLLSGRFAADTRKLNAATARRS